MNNISNIVDSALCTGCGSCSSICSQKAIQMMENTGGFIVARVNPELCINCGLCYSVCPSNPNNHIIDNLNDYIHGPSLYAYIGHATERKIRFEGQSGGVVTALLLYLIESGKIDGAITTHFDQRKQRPIAVFSKSREEIIDSAGSYYSQSSVAQEALMHQNKKISAVTLGCQAEALRLTDKKCPDYLIGLICAGQNSGHMIDELIRYAGCEHNERVAKFRFRYSHPAYGNWPGNVFIRTDKHRYTLDKSVRLSLKPFFESYRCKLCADQMAIHSDLACGDPWGIPGNHENGESVILVHTNKGMDLLNSAAKAGYIDIMPINPSLIMQGETVDTRHKSKVLYNYAVCKRNGWDSPYIISSDVFNDNYLKKSKMREYNRGLVYSRSQMLSDDYNNIKRERDNYKAYITKKKKLNKIKSIPVLFFKRTVSLFRKLTK